MRPPSSIGSQNGGDVSDLLLQHLFRAPTRSLSTAGVARLAQPGERGWCTPLEI
jgi:hypothetical protein